MIPLCTGLRSSSRLRRSQADEQRRRTQRAMGTVRLLLPKEGNAWALVRLGFGHPFLQSCIQCHRAQAGPDLRGRPWHSGPHEPRVIQQFQSPMATDRRLGRHSVRSDPGMCNARSSRYPGSRDRHQRRGRRRRDRGGAWTSDSQDETWPSFFGASTLPSAGGSPAARRQAGTQSRWRRHWGHRRRGAQGCALTTVQLALRGSSCRAVRGPNRKRTAGAFFRRDLKQV